MLIHQEVVSIPITCTLSKIQVAEVIAVVNAFEVGKMASQR